MKKVSIISLSFLIFSFFGCKDKNETIDNFNAFTFELKEISKLKGDYTTGLSPCNPNNLYDNWGESLVIGISKLRNTNQFTIYDSEQLKKELLKVIPEEFLYLDTKGVDIKKVSLIFDEFLEVFINRHIFEAVTISREMENHILRTRVINESEKAYLLKMVSILRFSSFYAYENSKSEDGSFERCWKRKLQEMEDSGIFTQLACIYSWPVCFGAMLADCVVEEIVDHIL